MEGGEGGRVGGGEQQRQVSDVRLRFSQPALCRPAATGATGATGARLVLPSLISNLGRDRLKDSQIKQCSQTVTCDK